MRSLGRYASRGHARGVRFIVMAIVVTFAYVTMISVQSFVFGPVAVDQFRTAERMVTGNKAGSRTLFAIDAGNVTTSANNTSNKTAADPLFPPDLFTLEQKQHGAVILHVVGMVYMFVALAIVCDEFFIPALDVIIEKLEIQDDVAGATFMAAGGSAPELFTSVIGVFVSFDDVGIGTIVGSAVFNILFVIGMCALFSRSVLNLTWWPLFRDVSFYSISLIVLIGFFLDNFIYWWEALLLLFIYASYVYFMRWNVQVERWMKKHLNRNKVARVSSADQLVACSNGAPAAAPKLNSTSDTLQLPPEGPSHRRRRSSTPMIHAGSKFRHGLLQLMIHSIDPMHEGQRNARSDDGSKRKKGCLCRSAEGKLDEKATQIHAIASLKVLLDATRTAGSSMSTADTATATTTAGVSETDSQDNLPSLTTHTVAADCSHVLQDIDTISENDQFQEDDIREMSLSESGNRLNHVSTANSLGASRSGEGTSGLNDTKVNADDLEGKEPLDMSWPDTNRKRITYVCLAPIVIPLWLTLPDPRKPAKKKWFAMTFIGSIVWIAIFSYLMVWWASQVGITLNIPNEVMGLTFLAAGTSIPDLITSVIVARKGLGDMAVSSSIGSNIFDVTVGLPLPWFLYGLVKMGQPVIVSSEGMVCSIVILFVMLLFVIMTIACCRWRMNKSLGVTMFLLYFVFLAVSLLFEYGTWTCPI